MSAVSTLQHNGEQGAAGILALAGAYWLLNPRPEQFAHVSPEEFAAIFGASVAAGTVLISYVLRAGRGIWGALARKFGILAIVLLFAAGCATGVGNFESEQTFYRPDGSIERVVKADCEGIMIARGDASVCTERGAGADGGVSSPGFVEIAKAAFQGIAAVVVAALKFVVPAGLAPAAP